MAWRGFLQAGNEADLRAAYLSQARERIYYETLDKILESRPKALTIPLHRRPIDPK